MEHVPPETQEDSPSVVSDEASTADADEQDAVAPDRPDEGMPGEKSGDVPPQE